MTRARCCRSTASGSAGDSLPAGVASDTTAPVTDMVSAVAMTTSTSEKPASRVIPRPASMFAS